MRVTISEVTGPLEAIFAAGLKHYLVIQGLDVDVLSLPVAPPTPADPEVTVVRAAVTPDPKPERKKSGPKPKSATSVEAPSTSVEKREVPRKSNRELVLDYLRANPAQTSTQIARGLGLEPSQVSNLLWNSKKASEVTKDESQDPAQWSVAK